MANVYNYTGIIKREKRKYSVNDLTISTSGISYLMIKVYAGCFVAVLPIFLALGFAFPILFNPLGILEGKKAVMYFWIALLGVPYGAALALLKIKITNLPLLEYIGLLLTPRKPIDIDGKSASDSGATFDTTVYKI